MIILQRGVNGNNRKARIQCPSCKTISENACYYNALRGGEERVCNVCMLTERNQSQEMRSIKSKEVDKIVFEKNSEENGLYIIKFTEKRHKCLVRCKHCKDEYEINYSPDVYDRFGCKTCMRLDKRGKPMKGHSVNSKHRLAGIFASMKERTGAYSNNTSKLYYEDIEICKEWLDNVESFYSWSLANGYADDLTIDRRDNSKGYSPDNCRWTTKEVQSRNTKRLRSTNTSGYRGVSLTINKQSWRSRITVSNKEIMIGVFETAVEAAYAYDNYVLEHNLEHTRNFATKELK